MTLETAAHAGPDGRLEVSLPSQFAGADVIVTVGQRTVRRLAASPTSLIPRSAVVLGKNLWIVQPEAYKTRRLNGSRRASMRSAKSCEVSTRHQRLRTVSARQAGK